MKKRARASEKKKERKIDRKKERYVQMSVKENRVGIFLQQIFIFRFFCEQRTRAFNGGKTFFKL